MTIANTTQLKLTAPAKVNLMLDISAIRPDGYHDIESVMQTVSLCDGLTLERRPAHGDKRTITLTCSNDSLACDETNLCYRAALLFMEHIGERSCNISIHIDKRIPIAGGLAGGSTDAAATLIGLNRLWNAGLTVEELARLGSKLGADIPFCIKRGISITRGIGDRLIDCPRLPPCKLLIACDGEGVSTPWAYRRLDEMYDFSSRKVSADSFAELLREGDLEKIAAGMTNIFESAVLPVRPRAVELRDRMLKAGALNALMSGSGPSIFGIFADATACDRARLELIDAGIRAYVCEPYYND